jgi:hypothetical protein
MWAKCGVGVGEGLKVVVTAQDQESCRSLDGRQSEYMWDRMSCERRASASRRKS